MLIFSQEICHFLDGSHVKTVEQDRLSQHNMPTQAQLRDDLRVQKEVFELTLELIALKQEIDDAEQEREKIEELLQPHKNRLRILVRRYRPMKMFFESQGEHDNVELVVSRIKRMESGVEEIDQLINAKNEMMEQLRSVRDGIVRTIIRRTQVRSIKKHDQLELDGQSLITESMVLPDSLDTFEDQAAEIEDEMEAVAVEQSHYTRSECDGAVTSTSEDARRHERIELIKRLGHLKLRRTDLEKHANTGAWVAEETEALTRQINRLGDEIAIRGTPCIEGNIIFQDNYEDRHNAAKSVSQDSLRSAMDEVSDRVAGPRHVIKNTYAGPGLFNGVVDIEVPGNNLLCGEDRFGTEAERARRIQRSINRVALWVSQLEDNSGLHKAMRVGHTASKGKQHRKVLQLGREAG